MKEILFPLSAYHVWANTLLAGAILDLPEAQQTAPVASSFNSLFKTLLHMWDAEAVWWQRMKLSEKVVVPSEGFEGSTALVVQGLLQQNKMWQQWLQTAQEHMLQHQFIYQNTKREQFKQPVYQMLIHLFNHGTYHRGQLVNMLRQLGIEKIPQTDFIIWSRKHKGQL